MQFQEREIITWLEEMGNNKHKNQEGKKYSGLKRLQS